MFRMLSLLSCMLRLGRNKRNNGNTTDEKYKKTPSKNK